MKMMPFSYNASPGFFGGIGGCGIGIGGGAGTTFGVGITLFGSVLLGAFFVTFFFLGSLAMYFEFLS
jgi:hypothetical protein